MAFWWPLDSTTHSVGLSDSSVSVYIQHTVSYRKRTSLTSHVANE